MYHFADSKGSRTSKNKKKSRKRKDHHKTASSNCTSTSNNTSSSNDLDVNKVGGFLFFTQFFASWIHHWVATLIRYDITTY